MILAQSNVRKSSTTPSIFMLITFLLALVLASVIYFAPSYLFSSEQFALMFSGYGGLLHEASFALIVSAIFVVIYLLKKTTLIKITQISIITSFILVMFTSLKAIYSYKYLLLNIEGLLFAAILAFFLFIYYLAVLLIPTLIVSKIRVLVIRMGS